MAGKVEAIGGGTGGGHCALASRTGTVRAKASKASNGKGSPHRPAAEMCGHGVGGGGAGGAQWR